MDLLNPVVVDDEASRAAGFVAPVVIARDVWNDCVAWPDTRPRDAGRCVEDRLSILLSVAWEVVRCAGGLSGRFSPTEFAVRRFPVDGPQTLMRVPLMASLTDEGVVVTRPDGGGAR
jgi:hypothetical protein